MAKEDMMEYQEDYELEEIASEEEEDIAMSMSEEEILQALITCGDRAKTKTYWVKEKGIPITIKGLTEIEFAQARKEATQKKKVRGQWVTDVNDATLSAAIVARATVSPNFNDRKLLDAFRVSSGTEYLKRQFYSGTLNNICDKVLTLSGFDDDLEEVKNS